MKLNFIIPFNGNSGGNYVIMRYANHMFNKGHDIRIYYPLIPYYEFFFSKNLSIRKILRYLWVTYKSLKQKNLSLSIHGIEIPCHPLLMLNNRTIRDADVVVATAWPTANTIMRLGRSKGIKLYFIQDIEIWGCDERKVLETYSLPIRQVTVSPWLSDQIFSIKHALPDIQIDNAVDNSVFKLPLAGRDWRCPHVIGLFNPTPHKGSAVLFSLVKILRSLSPKLRITLFGHERRLPKEIANVEYLCSPSQEKLVALYQNATILVCTSNAESWGMTITEAMACGCAVVSTRIGCTSLFKENEEILLAEPGDVSQLKDKVMRLLNNADYCKQIAEAGAQATQRLRWEDSERKFEEFLQTLTGDV